MWSRASRTVPKLGPARLPPERGPLRAPAFDPSGVVWRDELLTVTAPEGAE